jgi:transposase
MVYMGIDWSQDFHTVCILNEAGARVSRFECEHTPAGFEKINGERRKLGLAASECLVGIETSYNLVVDFLLDNTYPVYLIPPQATAAYRNRQRTSGAYDDNTDAALLASIVRTDRDSHTRLQPNTPLTQQIAAHLRLAELLRGSIQRQTNQLRSVLLRTYPTAVGLFSDLAGPVSLDFLIAYPTAAAARALSRADFEAFCREHHYTRTDQLPKRYAHLIEPALEVNPAVVQAYQDHVRILAHVLRPQVAQRHQVITQLSQLFAQHPDAAIFSSLPGVGALLAPGLLVKFGDHRDRFPSPAGAQALAGTCPITARSGKNKKLIKFRHGCDKEFRRFAQQFALASLAQSTWAAAYWDEIHPHCDSDSHALRILANRWLAIIWKMWQDRKPYDEAYHLQQRALRRRPKA